AELCEVAGHELRVAQLEAAELQTRDEMDERDLRGVRDAAEHALAEERRAEPDAVEAPRQRALPPRLDAVRVAGAEQRRIELDDALVDPRRGPIGVWLGAAAHH